MELGKQANELHAVCRGGVAPKLTGLASDEGKDSDAVPDADSADCLAAARRQWRDDKFQAATVSQSSGGIEGALQAGEHVVARVTEPRLVFQIVDRHEEPLVTVDDCNPVIAAKAHSGVFERIGNDAPTLRQRESKVLVVEARREVFHDGDATSVEHGGRQSCLPAPRRRPVRP